MTRAELSQLDRETLIVRADALGVPKARTLTRPELVDEILLRTSEDPHSMRLARGFFGLARDLLARVVERGLHLPDAAERIRGVSPPPPPRQVGPAIPTITLADIYASQGHVARAADTLRALLVLDPSNEAARCRLASIETSPVHDARDASLAAAAEAEQDALVAEGFEPEAADVPAASGVAGAAEGQEAPDGTAARAGHGNVQCLAIPLDECTMHISWRGVPAGGAELRLLVASPGWHGTSRASRRVALEEGAGTFVMRDLAPGTVVRAAVRAALRAAVRGMEAAASADVAGGSKSWVVAPALVLDSRGEPDGALGQVALWTPRGAVSARDVLMPADLAFARADERAQRGCERSRAAPSP